MLIDLAEATERGSEFQSVLTLLLKEFIDFDIIMDYNLFEYYFNLVVKNISIFCD